MQPPDDIALIDLHDSVIGSIALGRDGPATLAIDRLFVFRRVGPQLYDVWTYRGRLMVDEPSDLGIVGRLGNGWISEGTLKGPTGETRDPLELVNGGNVTVVDLAMQAGSTIHIVGRRIRVELLTPIEKVEQWSGPLSGSGPG